MAQSKKWLDFEEIIRHDICSCNFKLAQRGYKVDENRGIKHHCFVLENINVNSQKSCDYLVNGSNHGICIEFSDLFLQYSNPRIPHDLVDRWEGELLNNPLIQSRSKKKSAVKLFNQIKFDYQLSKEIVSKIEGTDYLLDLIVNNEPKFFLDSNLGFLSTNKFVLIWHDVDNDEGVYRVLDNVKTSVEQHLNNVSLNHISKEIIIALIDEFFEISDSQFKFSENTLLNSIPKMIQPRTLSCFRLI